MLQKQIITEHPVEDLGHLGFHHGQLLARLFFEFQIHGVLHLPVRHDLQQGEGDQNEN
ncbi:hypothetical protein D3C72_2455740 [compost metagenome]